MATPRACLLCALHGAIVGHPGASIMIEDFDDILDSDLPPIEIEPDGE